MTKNGLIYLIDKYRGSIQDLINSNFEFNREIIPYKEEKEQWDDSILWALQVHRHWFSYKIPKWLSVFYELQKYICEKHNLKPGEYLYFANQLENDFIQENLALLLEFGIPLSAIKKLEPKIPRELPEEEVIQLIRSLDIEHDEQYITYEKEKIKTNL